MNLPIRLRLTFWYIGLLALLLVVLSSFVVLRLRADLVAGVDRSLDLRAAQIALGFHGSGEGEFQDISDLSLRGLPRGESAAQLLSRSGVVLETSGDPVAAERLVTTAQLDRVFHEERVAGAMNLGSDREAFRFLAVRLPRRHAGEAVVVATSLEDVNGSIHRLLVLLLVAGPAALVLAAAGGWLLARRALAPVSSMTAEAAAIGPDRLAERVRVPPSRDELARLATTLNSMLGRIQRAAEDRRRLVADASHELRTPLAIMRSELEVALRRRGLAPPEREVLESSREEVERMSVIVDNLLTLAQLDEGRFRLVPEVVALRGVADEVAAGFEPLARAREISVVVSGDGAEVLADPAWLRHVLANLVDNAVKYSSSFGDVAIDVWRNSGRAGLTVTDSGPGIAPDALSHVFDRFFRAEASRSRHAGGSGLGLAIVKEVVEAQGGHVEVESEQGRGSSFSIALPIAGDSPDA